MCNAFLVTAFWLRLSFFIYNPLDNSNFPHLVDSLNKNYMPAVTGFS